MNLYEVNVHYSVTHVMTLPRVPARNRRDAEDAAKALFEYQSEGATSPRTFVHAEVVIGPEDQEVASVAPDVAPPDDLAEFVVRIKRPYGDATEHVLSKLVIEEWGDRAVIWRKR